MKWTVAVLRLALAIAFAVAGAIGLQVARDCRGFDWPALEPHGMFRTPLAEICRTYDPDAHPITGPLLRGGPAGLMREYGLTPSAGYADACHLCYRSRAALRPRFPEVLGPDQMYGDGAAA